MKRSLSTVFWVVSMATFCTTLAQEQHTNSKSPDDENINRIIPGVFHRERQKRMARLGGLAAAMFRGKKATQKVLDGAKPVGASKSMRWFEKSGGWDQAKKDFARAGPNIVIKYQAPDGASVMSGKIGTRDILVRSGAGKNPPELKIIYGKDDIDGLFVDVITYRST